MKEHCYILRRLFTQAPLYIFLIIKLNSWLGRGNIFLFWENIKRQVPVILYHHSIKFSLHRVFMIGLDYMYASKLVFFSIFVWTYINLIRSCPLFTWHFKYELSCTCHSPKTKHTFPPTFFVSYNKMQFV